MATKLLYLENTYLNEAKGEVLKIVEDESGGKGVVLDQTIFYPQGGGQPFDKGWMRFVKDGIIHELEVERVFLDRQTSEVVHWFKMADDMVLPVVGMILDLEIDMDRRLLNAASHTVGHCIDLVSAMGFVDGLDRAFKGDHDPASAYAYVKFDQVVGDTEIAREQIQEGMDKLREMAIGILQRTHEGVTDGAPEGKTYREVYFEGQEEYSVGCGGTHLSNTSEIPEVNIISVKSKKGSTTVKYELS